MDTAALEKLLAGGTDTALLRFSLAGACRGEGRLDEAIVHARRAVELEPDYSAAWKLYAGLLAQTKRVTEALLVYERGIEVAEKGGDVQAAKEMRVFLKRLQRQ